MIPSKPFALVFNFSALLGDNLNWNSCILVLTYISRWNTELCQFNRKHFWRYLYIIIVWNYSNCFTFLNCKVCIFSILIRSIYTQVDNLAKIPARSWQDLTKIMPRSYINLARSWKDLAGSCKIFPSSYRILPKILQDLTRSCQDLSRKILPWSFKILPKLPQDLAMILHDLTKNSARSCHDPARSYTRSYQNLANILP